MTFINLKLNDPVVRTCGKVHVQTVCFSLSVVEPTASLNDIVYNAHTTFSVTKIKRNENNTVNEFGPIKSVCSIKLIESF